MLGEHPKQLKAVLNFREPGPVEFSFTDDLTNAEQKQVLIGLEKDIIETDVSFATLYEVYLRGTTPMATEPKVEPLPKAVAEPVPTPTVAPPVSAVEKKDVADKKIQEKVDWLIAQRAGALLTAIKQEKQIRVLRSLRTSELKKKVPRAKVLAAIDERLIAIQQTIGGAIKDSEDKPLPEAQQKLLDKLNKQTETQHYKVVESEKETIQFEFLNQFAQGNPLGGE